MSKTTVAFVSAVIVAGSAFAQPPAQPKAQPQPAAKQPAPAPAAPAATAAPAPAPKPAPTWSDPDFAKVGKLIEGTWKTTAPVAQLGSSTESSDVVMQIAHVANTDLKDALYVESSRLDSLHAPYRHALFQLYKYKGNIRLRTYEFLGSDFDPGCLTGLWATPEHFPEIKRTSLIATLDVELKPIPNGNGFTGATPYPYPTGIGGAVEMTSNIVMTGDAFTVADRGLDAAGTVVWGSDEKSKYTFTRFNPPIKVVKKDNGVVVVEYKKPSEGRLAENNDRVGLHFTGWLMNGYKWDSSRTRPNPAIFQIGGSPIAGLNDGLVGTSVGTIMRMYLPAAQAFGPKGYGNGKIPPNADLLMEVEIMSIDTPPTQVVPSGAEGAVPQPTPPATPPQAPPTAAPKR